MILDNTKVLLIIILERGVKMKIISLASFKGGTGKTLTTFNLMGILAKEYDKKILLIDADPQHNSTHLLAEKYEKGIEDIFNSDINNTTINPTEVIQSSYLNNIDILPSSIRLIKTESEITTHYGKEFILKRWINKHQEELSAYDYIFIDTNPTMSTVNINSFLISDSIILITDVDIDSLVAIDTFLDSYYPIQDKVLPENEHNIKGILVNKLKETTNMDKDFIEYINSDNFEHKDLVLPIYIHDTVALRETKVTSEPISKEANKRAYNEFVELIEVLKQRGVL